MNKYLSLRPHHGLCLRFFEGKGYSPAFTAHMAQVQKQLYRSPAQLITLQCCTDTLCSCCPHNQAGMCESGQKVKSFDTAVLQLCGLQEQTPITWSDFCVRIENCILKPGKLQQVCVNCQWLDICKNK